MHIYNTQSNVNSQGIIHGPNRTEEGCYALGKGSRKTYLRLDLARAPGTPGSCGVKYNKVDSKTYFTHELFHYIT